MHKSLDDFSKHHVPLLRNTFFLSLDIIPTLFISYVCATLTGQTNIQNEKENSFAASLGIFFVNTIAALFIFRQQLRFMAHMLVLSLTNTTENKSEFLVCKKNNCNTARYVKREFYDIIFYLAQVMMISLLKLIPSVGWFIALVSRMLLNAQVSASYVLAEKKVCGLHREVYYLEHYKFFFALGFIHYAISFIIAKQLEQIPGVSRDQMELAIGAILSLYLVEFMRHIDLPKPVLETKSRWYDPLTITRNLLSGAMDFIIPSVKKRLNEMAEKRKEKTWVMIRSGVENITQNKVIQFIYTSQYNYFLMPIIKKDFQHFMQDPIMSEYWPRVAENMVYHIERLLQLRPRILQFVAAVELYQKNAETVKDAVGIASTILNMVAGPYATVFFTLLRPLTIAVGIENGARYLGNQSQLLVEIRQLLRGIPRGVIDMMIGALKDKIFVEDAKTFSLYLKEVLVKYYDQKTNGCVWTEGEKHWSEFEKLLNEFSLVEKPSESSTENLTERCEYPQINTPVTAQPDIKNGGRNSRSLSEEWVDVGVKKSNSSEWDENIPSGNSKEFRTEFVLRKKRSDKKRAAFTDPCFSRVAFLKPLPAASRAIQPNQVAASSTPHA